jgi:hypothetical protein
MNAEKIKELIEKNGTMKLDVEKIAYIVNNGKRTTLANAIKTVYRLYGRGITSLITYSERNGQSIGLVEYNGKWFY